MIPSYGKIIALDNKLVGKGTLEGKCVVQEKVDGSQVSFKVELVGDYLEYVPLVKSKNQIVQDGNGMFQMVVDWVRENKMRLDPNFTYRGEAVTSLKHNTLKYERVPVGGVVVYDIYDEKHDYMLLPAEIERECERLGLEAVHTFVDSMPIEVGYLHNCITHGKPQLGGKQIEGVVVKRYDLPDPSSWANTNDKQGFLKVKLVSSEFKEVHNTRWKADNPNGKDTVANLIEVYGTEARLAKAVQHLRDDNLLAHEPKDIGDVMKEVVRDLREECEEEIKDKLFAHFGKQILRGIAAKVPNYYKTEVLGLIEGEQVA